MSHFGIDPRKSNDSSAVKSSLQSKYHASAFINPPQQRNRSGSFRSNVSLTQLTKLSPLPNQFNGTPTERMNRIFDSFINNLENESFSISLENAAKLIFNANTAFVWIRDNESIKIHSPTLGKVNMISEGIVGFIMTQHKSTLLVPKPSAHPSFSADVDINMNSPSIYIPILVNSNSFDTESIGSDVSVVVVISTANRFTEADEALASAFSRKLSLYSHFFDRNGDTKILSNISSTFYSMKVLVTELQRRLCQLFSCRTVEFWGTDCFNTAFMKYNDDSGQFELFSKDAGIVAIALTKDQPLNIANVQQSPEFNKDVDGAAKEAVLIEPMNIDSNTYCVVFRRTMPFSVHDELLVKSLIPFIARSLGSGSTSNALDLMNYHEQSSFSPSLSDNNAKNSPDKAGVIQTSQSTKNKSMTNGLNFNADFAERLKALLEVAEIISGVLDIDLLIPTIMERSCSLLNTERCSLFLVDMVKQELVSRFHGGLKKSIRLPIGRGIVGHTATTGNIVNIADAYQDPRFDKQVDLTTGFRTKTILTVPIYNNRGEIAGVTEMINKLDGGAFDEEDIKMMMAFNVFCGISLDNAKLYQTSLNLTRQLRSFVEMSSKMSQSSKIHDVLEAILSSAKEVINATRATVFMVEEDSGKSLLPFVNIGASVSHGSIFADDIVEGKEPKIFSRQEIFYKIQAASDKALDGLVGSGASGSALSSQKSLSRVSSYLIKDDIIDQQTTEVSFSENICGIPMISSEGKILGVMELSSVGKILKEDLKLLDCFAVFMVVSLERSELQEIAEMGQVEVELKQYLTLDERKAFDIPMKMRIEQEKLDTLFTINFDAVYWDGVGHYKVLWAIADTFDLLREFNIPNEKWFRFLIEISQTYKKVPYHNWRHAVDVTQFVTYELKLTKMEEKLSKFELLGFIVAAICHDANHDGFTNAFNEKAETPLGILYKNQSVMETHHCTVAITVISKEECNIFSSLDADQYKNMWNMIIQLILITDMAKHFDFLKVINADMDKGPYDISDQESRLKMMQAILKCADISNVSRPFELADKWCDVLCEEFFRQGDLEMAHGMEYTSPLNDREHLDKPKSQIGFYTFVCLPLYQATARIFPELDANVQQVQSNLKVWKEASEAKS